MNRYCEVTKQKSGAEESKKPFLRKRKVEVPELKTAIRLTLSEAGVKVIKDAGGLKKYVLGKEEKQLTPKLKSLRARFPEAKQAPAEKKEEAAPAPAPAPAEEAKPAE